jgi:hypothetical protein
MANDCETNKIKRVTAAILVAALLNVKANVAFVGYKMAQIRTCLMQNTIKAKSLVLGALILSFGLSGCMSNTRPFEISQGETGVLARVEAGTIVSITPVTISGLNAPRLPILRKRSRGVDARGVTLVLRIERNSELVAVTQGDDVGFQAGQNVWVQYGDRVRVIPR